MMRKAGIAGAAFLFVYAVVSVATGQRVIAVGDFAQLVPPLAYGAFTLWLARQSRGQVRVFWNLNAVHAFIWAAGQALWTYLDLFNSGGVPVITPTDPIFFASSIPLAAALYGRPERDRPRWLFDIVLLDLVLIALFAAFLYSYFIVTIVVTDGREDLYDSNLRQLLNARNLLLAGWATWVWRTSVSPAWRRTLGIYALALGATFLGGVIGDVVDGAGSGAGSLADVIYMAPYALMLLAAAAAYDAKLFEPEEAAPPLSRLPVVSLIAITLLIAIPTIDEISRRFLHVSDATAALRTRVALAMMIPFGIVVVVREFLSRRALIKAGQDLATTRQQLVQHEKLAAVGQLVSGVAHELNNPLQGVIGYAELMLASKPPGLETEELRAIRDNANRAAGIVRNLLTFAGRNTSARGWQQINRIVRDAVAVREPQLQSAGIDLILDVADRLPLVYVDHTRLEDVIVNLIQNAEAAIASRRDGNALTRQVPERARGEIRVVTRMQPEPDRIFVEVADNGSGLKPEDLLRVFDPFFTTREVGQGTGLGLSVCYGIVREHGGQIVARNAPAGGAVFTIELPVMAESLVAATAVAAGFAPPVAAPAAAAPVPIFSLPADDELDSTPRQRKALVVDDEESNAALVRRVLAGAGYDVESTTLSRRALVMIERTAYDAVIADVKMPELSGQELYGRVCQIRPEMARRFIFITGDIDGEDTREFLEQTHCSYFMKPFNLERLTAAVDMLTGSKSPDTIG
jgi:signal transduction histidine kinase/CheY-like chemotaxis protein